MKKHFYNRDSVQLDARRALLMALSDDLALPLLQVKSNLELLADQNFTKAAAIEATSSMSLSAEIGLQLVEAYRLILATDNLASMPPEPLAIGVVLEEIAHNLSPYAKQYSTGLVIDVPNRLMPVLAHGQALTAAMQVLSASLIRAQAAQSRQKSYQLVLAAHRVADGSVSTGVFSNLTGLSDRTLRAARTLTGQARQPLPALPPGAASGILMADYLCATLWQPLRAAAHHNLNGLATSLPTTSQLQFV